MTPCEWVTAIVCGLGEARTEQVALRLPSLTRLELHQAMQAAQNAGRIRRVDYGRNLSIAVWASPEASSNSALAAWAAQAQRVYL